MDKSFTQEIRVNRYGLNPLVTCSRLWRSARDSWTAATTALPTAPNRLGSRRTGHKLEKILELVVMKPEIRMHREAERSMKEAKVRMASQDKILLLASGDSDGSTILKQMKTIHKITYSPIELETYRLLIFDNITSGMIYILDALEHMELRVSPMNIPYVDLIRGTCDLCDSEPFSPAFHQALVSLWDDPSVQTAWTRRNEAAFPENLSHFFSSLDRLFDPSYYPTEQDILHTRTRSNGITETTFRIRDYELVMVDPSGCKGERRKWMHLFQVITGILFVVDLCGYDQCLVEDRDANRMQDAMTVWDSICHSQWFRQTPIILLLNNYDLFAVKIETSPIQNFFPDFGGEPGDVSAGVNYFKRRFARLARRGRTKVQEFYIHTTTATDTSLLRIIISAVEDMKLNQAMRSVHLS